MYPAGELAVLRQLLLAILLVFVALFANNFFVCLSALYPPDYLYDMMKSKPSFLIAAIFNQGSNQADWFLPVSEKVQVRTS